MRYYTVQNAAHTQLCLDRGILRAEQFSTSCSLERITPIPRDIPKGILDVVFDTGKIEIDPYAWIALKLAFKLGPPPSHIFRPLWVWKQEIPECELNSLEPLDEYENAVGIAYITVDIPDGGLVLTDYYLWLHCLHNEPILMSIQEKGYFECLKTRDHQMWQSAMVDSWNTVFDLDQVKEELVYGEITSRITQGCLWEIPVSCIRSIKYFAEVID